MSKLTEEIVDIAKAAAGFVQQEADPNGIAAHVPGAKLDAGKRRDWLLLSGFALALRRVSDVMTYGAKKYTPNGWKSVPDGEARYLDAAARHLSADASGEKFDRETDLPHLAHAAWNLLAVLELQEKKRDEANCRFIRVERDPK